MKATSLASVTLALSLAACSDDPNGPPNGEVITLSAGQAAALVSRIESFGASDPTLQALADTIDVVIKAGAQARRVEITNSQGGSLFYAVSLHRTNAQSNPAWSTFHIIAFDDPTTPTIFVILGGSAFATGSSTPPGSAAGPIGAGASNSLTGHLFAVSGNQVSSWNASGGTSSMTADATTQQCDGFAGPGTCVKSAMDASFTITASVAGNGTTGARTWSGTITGAPGIQLGM
jgi:hypothetical protein